MQKDFKKEYFSIPNLMGYFRIFLAVLYLYFFIDAMHGGTYWYTIVVIAISALTDFFDGKIARRFDMVTDWGKMLDPVADKFTIGIIILSLSIKYRIVIIMVILYLAKEGYMAVKGMQILKGGYKIEGAMWYGKMCTFGTYVILLALLVFPKMPMGLVNTLIIVNMAVMIFTWIKYVIYYRKVA